MTPVSRGEGYRRGAGKEEEGLQLVESFFREELDVELQRSEDAEDNYALGDFVTEGAATLECKRQPIDPYKYKRNFVEIFERTNNERHADGLDDLAGLLKLSVRALQSTPVQNKVTRKREPVGEIPFVSVSVRSIFSAANTVYVNPSAGGSHIYIYTRLEIGSLIRRAVAEDGFVRGAGNSNEDTYGVFIPVSGMRWERFPSQGWVYRGDPGEAAAVQGLKELLR